MSAQLLPCPFCGGEARPHRFLKSYVTIECSICYAELPGHSKAEACAAWNRRTPPEGQPCAHASAAAILAGRVTL
jgi:Lar family restriction alleviation protein